MLYYVFSDLHLHKFNDYSRVEGPYGNTRLEAQVNALNDILKKASEETEEVTVLFLGDLYHQRGRVDTEVFNAGYETFSNYPNIPIIIIEGNHDNVNNSIHSHSSLELYELLPNVTLIREYEKLSLANGDTLVGVSYGEEYDELKAFIKDNTATMLLAHLGVQGSRGAGQSKLDGPFTTGDLCVPNNYEIGLLGHYHNRQELVPGVYYVGNPVAQNFGDSGEEKGYMTFETRENHVISSSISFHPLPYPMFIKVTNDNLDKYGTELEELAKNNFIRVIVDEKKFDMVKISGEEKDLPENLRIEKQLTPVSETRIDISDIGSTLEIAKQWSDEFQPDNKDVIIKQLKKVI